MGANASHEALGPGGAPKPHSTGNVFNPYGRASIRRSLRRRKSKRKNKDGAPGSQVDGQSEAHLRRMDKLRKSLRDSFRKKKDVAIPEASKPHLWHADESAVRAGTCSFYVKYIGCVEVYESRGMQVCEEALKVLRASRRRPVRGILYVSGDGLRVVDDETKGLIVDQTIEKVSFCAPDRNHERGFSYICRDGTTRRWMCHGFIAVKDSGERLSHAVGCAFAVCLERKQKRDNECGVTMSFDKTTSTFTRMGSFRQMTVTERLNDPQECKPLAEPVPLKKVENPHAIARPHATPQLLQRQGSFRVFNHMNQSPFKRQLSLRISDLPSNIERTRSLSFDVNSSSNAAADNNINNNHISSTEVHSPSDMGPLSPPAPSVQRSRLHSLPLAVNMAPIPESSPLGGDPSMPPNPDAVSAMCQQVSAGLSLLSNFPEDVSNTQNSEGSISPSFCTMDPVPPSASPSSLEEMFINHGQGSDDRLGTDVSPSLLLNETHSKAEEWLAQINSKPAYESGQMGMSPRRRPPHLSELRSSSLGGCSNPAAATSPNSLRPHPTNFSTSFSPTSLTNGSSGPHGNAAVMGPYSSSKPSNATDPFDAEWASTMAQSSHNPNNPFLQNTVTKAFQVQM